MAELFEITLDNGYKMKGNSFLVKKAKANLVFITGMQEYSLRYTKMAEWMNDNGVNVWVLDQIGQGSNVEKPEDQQKVCEGAFQLTVEGLAKTVELAKQNGLPTVQAGHSMGSFITQARLEQYPGLADKTLIIGSNGGQAFLMKMGYLLAKISVNQKNWDEPNSFLSELAMGGYAKAIKNSRTDLDWLSYNEKNVDKYLTDPYCGHPNTSGFWKEFLKGMKDIWTKKEMSKLQKGEKVLITSGEEDPVGQMGKGVKWLQAQYEKLGLDSKLILYPKMRHEIHNEDDREKVYKDWLDFILA